MRARCTHGVWWRAPPLHPWWCLPAALQVYLKHHRLPISGRKAELIERITAHMATQQ
jgi:hypothetical protein